MPASNSWSRWLLIVGLAGMLLGAIDPLEGSLIILPGVALVALGAFLGKSRYRRLLYWALALVATGLEAMWISSAFGGFGGGTGRPIWWGLLILVPYVVGWIMGLVGAIRALVEAFRRRARPNRGDSPGEASRSPGRSGEPLRAVVRSRRASGATPAGELIHPAQAKTALRSYVWSRVGRG